MTIWLNQSDWFANERCSDKSALKMPSKTVGMENVLLQLNHHENIKGLSSNIIIKNEILCN